MGDFLALSQLFPNWATIFILAFGIIAALDFQARCMAAKTPKIEIATLGCMTATTQEPNGRVCASATWNWYVGGMQVATR